MTIIGNKRPCFSCEKRPARVLKTKRRHYAEATKQSVFCSQACAADWALLQVGPLGGAGDTDFYFCKEHGWDTTADIDCGACEERDGEW